MAQSARLALSARRFELRTLTIRVTGLDLTGAALAMQVRLYPDTPGTPILDLPTVTTAAAEGLKLDGVTVENGVPVSTITLRINKSTMSDQAGLGRPAEPGVPIEFAYALRIGETTRLHGAFWALPGTVDADSATPTGDYSGGSRSAPEPADAIALTVAENEIIDIVIDGAAEVGALVAEAQQAADRAEAGAATAAGLIAQASAFANPSNTHPVFGNLAGQPRLYGANPTKFYSFDRLFFDSNGTRFSAGIREADDANGANSKLVAELAQLGGASHSGVKTITLSPVANSGITVELPLNFGAGTGWTEQGYAGSLTFANSGLSNKVIVDSAGWQGSVNRLIEAAIVKEDKLDLGPWVNTVRNERLRKDVVRARGFFTQTDHRYGISAIELSDFQSSLGYHRANITIRDFTKGVDVARVSTIFNTSPVGIEQRVFAHKATLPNFTGMYWLVTIGAEAQWTDGGNARTFTQYADAGFRTDTQASTLEVSTFLREPPPPHEQIDVAASGGDFQTVAAAHAAFYNAVYTSATEGNKYSAFPNSDVAGYPHRIEIFARDQKHDERLTQSVNLFHSTLRGRGMFNTRFFNDIAGKRVFETTWPGWKVDFAAEQFSDAYLDHSDNANALSKPAQIGDPVQNVELDKGYLRVWYRAHGDGSTSANAAACIGMGLSSGEKIRVRSCLFEQVGGGPVPAWICHNSQNSVAGGELHIEGGTVLRARADIPALELIGSWGQSNFNEVFVSADTTIKGGIRGKVSMADSDPAMPSVARLRWPFRVRGMVPEGIQIDDPKMRVLAINPGTSIGITSGVAGALFGARYDQASGRGEALTLDGSTQALASKLSGLQGATMSVGRDGFAAETVTIGDYSGMSEAQVLAAINAQLTNYAIQAVRIDSEIGAEGA